MENVDVRENGVLVAALLAVLTDWDKAEVRAGRRGEYRTTGASMYRIRELNEQEKQQVMLACGTLGIDVDEDDLSEIFTGGFEYQASYSCNRFVTGTGSGITLTSNERRILDRAASILIKKEKAAAAVLTMPRAA